MGSAPSGSNAIATRPAGIEEVNDSVFQLHKGSSDIPEVEIIFFHGLQLGDFEDAYWKTWLSRNGPEVWPQKWLSEEFPNARILSISYDSSARAPKGKLDMYKVGENLVEDIIFDRTNVGQKCPVVLVGHSLGGLVIKQFVNSCGAMKDKSPSNRRVKIETFLKNVKGVFYYAPPNQGTREGKLAQLIEGDNPILTLLKTLDKERARINDEFRKTRTNLNAAAYGIAESLPTQYKKFNDIVVPEGSSRFDIDSFYTAMKSNHFDVCRPPNRNSGIFQKLRDCITHAIA